MSTEQQLKELILKNYKSIREFSILANIPYSTIDSIFKRGVINAGVTNIIKICKILNIDVDELAKGKITEKHVEENEGIKKSLVVETRDEKIDRLTEFYRNSDPKVREMLDALADSFFDNKK